MPTVTWSVSPWRNLGFGPQKALRYGYTYSGTGVADDSEFVARAYGDIDGDSVIATYVLSGSIDDGGVMTINAPITPKGEDNALE